MRNRPRAQRVLSSNYVSLGMEPGSPTLQTDSLPAGAFPCQLVKNLPAMQEIWVQSLGWEDSLEKGKATYSSILAWRIPRTVLSTGLQRDGHD